jgi:hypothetical protein
VPPSFGLEGGDEAAQRVRRPEGVRVGEGDELAARPAHRRVLGADLAAARQLEHDVGARRPRSLGRRVRRAVARDDHLQAVGRVVERARVGDLAGDHLLLAVGGDDERDGRQLARARPLAVRRTGARRRRGRGPQHAREQREQQPVAGLRVEDQGRAGPEDDRDDEHGGGFSRTSRRVAPPRPGVGSPA